MADVFTLQQWHTAFPKAKTRYGHFTPSTTWQRQDVDISYLALHGLPQKRKSSDGQIPPKPRLSALHHNLHSWTTHSIGLGYGSQRSGGLGWAQLRSFQVSAHEQAGFPAWNCILRRGGKGEAMVEEGQSLQCWSPRKKQNKITHFCCTFTFFFPQKKVMMFGIERQPSHTHKALRSALGTCEQN